MELETHKCFIQPPRKRKRRGGKKNEAKRQRVDEDDFMEDECMDDVDDGDEEEKPTLHVYFDVEVMQMHGFHEPSLIICQTDESDQAISFQGEGCMGEFLDFIDECTEEDERNVTVIAHNFQAYDGYFVIKEYYGNNQIVSQIRNGAKLLQVKHDSVRFIDSLSFFQMPSSNFPKTFGLTELKKGFFPHLFNVPENQSYVGPIPAKDYFMVESMSVETKKEYEKWHADQVKDNVEFDFQKELFRVLLFRRSMSQGGLYSVTKIIY